MAHVANEKSASGVAPGREPGSVVADLEVQAGACLVESDPDHGRAVGVLDRVLQRLGAGEVDGALDLDGLPGDPVPDDVDEQRSLRRDGAQCVR